ncbi:unnamed protein product, partial [marine sediment metagenome]
YSKLSKKRFTTIRKNTRRYRPEGVYSIITPKQKFKAKVISRVYIKKEDITDFIALYDADCSHKWELIELLDKWYGREFNDFVLITLERID